MAKPTRKQTKIVSRRKKFFPVEIPMLNQKVELLGTKIEDVESKIIKLDLTRQLRGKGIEASFKVLKENDKAIAYPTKLKLMTYFIRRMIRKRISYVEDSLEIKSQQSLLKIKPFLITRKVVSRAVKKTIRNQTKNWLEDYISEKQDLELFNEILSNKLQKALSLKIKKTYPLSLCEIRIIEILRPLKPEEIPKIKEKPAIKKQKQDDEEIIDQMAEIEEELKKQKIKEAEEEIKKAQEKAEKKQKEIEHRIKEEKEPKENKKKSEEKKKTKKE